MTTLDLFAGPGGWDVAAQRLGVPDVIGLEWDAAACVTAQEAGHKRVQCDVSMVDTRDYTGVEGEIGSPPCQPYSRSGKQKGKLDRPRIERHVQRIRTAGRWLHYSREGWRDPRSPLVLEPLRFALELRPRWVALEQVPAVLPLWELFADALRDHGYHVAVGRLSAEQYGVPQTRLRAFLIAHADRPVALPAATHRPYRKGVPRDAGDPSLLPWVSMADALGWGFTDEPACPVSGGGTRTGGAEPFANADYRRRLNRFVVGQARGGAEWMAERPATTVQGDPRIWPPGHKVNGDDIARLGEDEARARYGNRAGNNGQVLSTGVNSATMGPGPRRDEAMAAGRWRDVHRGQERDVDAPAPTVDTKAGRAWRVHDPGERAEAIAAGTAVRVTVQQAAVLQSFPPDYPWCGGVTKQYEQVGNAVPPLLAEHVLQTVAGE